jgi:hypothetical protein
MPQQTFHTSTPTGGGGGGGVQQAPAVSSNVFVSLSNAIESPQALESPQLLFWFTFFPKVP